MAKVFCSKEKEWIQQLTHASSNWFTKNASLIKTTTLGVAQFGQRG